MTLTIIIILSVVLGAALMALWYMRRANKRLGNITELLADKHKQMAFKHLKKMQDEAKKKFDDADKKAKDHELDTSGDPDYLPGPGPEPGQNI